MGTKRPFHILAKPIGPICNLDCHYCFYLDRESLFPQHQKPSDFRMSDETLEKFIQQYIQFQPGREVFFTWQGGEPKTPHPPYAPAESNFLSVIWVKLGRSQHLVRPMQAEYNSS